MNEDLDDDKACKHEVPREYIPCLEEPTHWRCPLCGYTTWLFD